MTMSLSLFVDLLFFVSQNMLVSILSKGSIVSVSAGEDWGQLKLGFMKAFVNV